MNKKISLTIGIPAYNEAANIKSLLKDISMQKNQNYKLEKIYVYSDGSTDKTNEIVKFYKNRKIELLSFSKRRGQGHAQNVIIGKTNTDILVLINADTRILQEDFFQKLIEPIILKKADLTSAEIFEVNPSTFIEKILSTSTQYKKMMAEADRDGNNIYTCQGRARAFSKKLYSILRFKASIGEDAYSYLFAINNNMKYMYVKEARIYYKLPSNLKDHEKQSLRFYQSQNSFINEFGKDKVRKEYYIPPSIFMGSLLKIFLKDQKITFYFILGVYLKIKSLINSKQSHTWSPSRSSKKIFVAEIK